MATAHVHRFKSELIYGSELFDTHPNPLIKYPWFLFHFLIRFSLDQDWWLHCMISREIKITTASATMKEKEIKLKMRSDVLTIFNSRNGSESNRNYLVLTKCHDITILYYLRQVATSSKSFDGQRHSHFKYSTSLMYAAEEAKQLFRCKMPLLPSAIYTPTQPLNTQMPYLAIVLFIWAHGEYHRRDFHSYLHIPKPECIELSSMFTVLVHLTNIFCTHHSMVLETHSRIAASPAIWRITGNFRTIRFTVIAQQLRVAQTKAFHFNSPTSGEQWMKRNGKSRRKRMDWTMEWAWTIRVCVCRPIIEMFNTKK